MSHENGKKMYMYGSRKKCKNQFPITKRKLCSFNDICFDENDCNENSVFSWTYWDLARTNKTLESVHFIWRYIHETSKALYYVFEFKCSKVLKNQETSIWTLSIIQNIENLSTLNSINVPQTFWAQNTNFYRGSPLDSTKKLNIINLFLSFPWEIFCFGACLYAFSQFCLHKNVDLHRPCQEQTYQK